MDNKSGSLIIKFIALGMISVALFWACASQGKLTGGEEDTFPPQIRTNKSTPNYQTNFYPDKIELEFDEFITLNKPLQEIAISPPLRKIPQFSARGKKLEIKFPEDEELKSDATYTINFGSSIKDLREGNVLENFTYVFSTGDFLDSLSISGKVVDAFTKEPIENAVVMLYDVLTDSIIYQERPFYFSKTSKQGVFKINNIKNDTFQIFALVDQNLNYILDQEGESIGFLDSSFVLTDSSQSIFELELSKISFPPKITETKVSQDGKIVVGFTQELKSKPEVQFSENIIYKSIIEKDSLKVWYDTTGFKNFSMYTLGDTLKIKPKKKKRKTPYSLQLNKSKIKKEIVGVDSFKIFFDYPIIQFEKDSIFLIDSSDTLVDFEVHSLSDPRALALTTQWKTDISYELQIPDSTLYTYNNITGDSIKVNFTVLGPEKLGTINITFEDIELDSQVVFILLDQEKEIFTSIVTNAQKEISIPNLLPKTYSFYLIEDLNRNGKWDTGDYTTKRQAEKIIKKDLENLRENWELSTTISVSILNFGNNDTESK